MPDNAAPSKGSALTMAVGLIDSVVGELRSIGHAREPHEVLPTTMKLLEAVKAAGGSTIDDALVNFAAIQPLIERMQGVK